MVIFIFLKITFHHAKFEKKWRFLLISMETWVITYELPGDVAETYTQIPLNIIFCKRMLLNLRSVCLKELPSFCH